MTNPILLLIGILLNSAAQLLLKAGMQRIGHFDFVSGNVIPIALRIAFNLPILLGLSCYVVSLAVWLMVLSRLEVSLAYPLMSIGYVLTALSAWYFFGDNLSTLRMTGIGVIILGVFLVSKSA